MAQGFRYFRYDWSKLVSVKIPGDHLACRRLAKGRSRFIVAALEEKISRRMISKWKPITKRGRRLAALLKKGRHERFPSLDTEAIAGELAARRGILH